MVKIKISVILTLLIIPFVFIYPFGKNKVVYEIYDWQILSTVHFDIHYPPGMDQLALAAAEIAEQGYLRISDYLTHELTDPVPVIIFPSHVTFQNNNIIPGIIGQETRGFTESLKNRVVVPFTGDYGEFEQVLIHELVHAFQFNILFADTSGFRLPRLSFRRIPLWFVEGMAEYISLGFDETCDMVVRDALFNDYFVSLEDLTAFRVENNYLLYKQGQSFMYFLEKRYGKRVIGKIFRDLRDTGSIDTAFEVNTGLNKRELNQEWKRFYKRKYYHLVSDKEFVDETGRVITSRDDYDREINISPSFSPDGKKIAYITDSGAFPAVIVRSVENKTGRDSIKKIAVSGRRADFESLNIRRNSLSWTPEGDFLFFSAQYAGGDALYLVDVKRGKINKRIKIPMRSVSNPRLSADGKMAVFTGETVSGSDLYIYYLNKNRIRRLTDDSFVQKHPVFSRDGKSVIFSSNSSYGSLYSERSFDIFSLDLETGKISPLVTGYGNALQPDISRDGKRMIFVSNRTGIYNVYIYEFESGDISMATDLLSGASAPAWHPSGDRLAFVSYSDAGYDIIMKEIGSDSLQEPYAYRDTEYFHHGYIPMYLSPDEIVFDEYHPRLSRDHFLFGVAGARDLGFVGFAQISFSDYLGNHKLIFDTSYMRFTGSDYNLDIEYMYLKHRWDFSFSAFIRENPFYFYSLNDITDLVQNVNSATVYKHHYGAFLQASYPFNRFLRADIKTTVSRYAHDYSEKSPGSLDVRANLNQVSIAMVYDNVLWGVMVPLKGFRGRVEYEQALDITGKDHVYSSLDIDLRYYFLFKKRNVLALRGAGGTLMGPDSEYFKYYIGGYNTVRGHGFQKYGGENMFLLNAEYRFNFIEGLRMGWPFPLQVGSIGGVLFVDTGAAWDDSFTFKDPETGRWQDFKAGMGFGFRMVFYPLVVLKLDYSWPFDNEGIGSREVIISIGVDF